ncbi:MT-A70 family protein OS=Mesorhizobium alhagi CCNWXJ12-2 GN=MAXJ12_12747 PE=4 SV=1: ParBc [Gemmataceae bacterium]|nr:MT-A70 family protein OS=Mesorhizobium alhagi CCNWXJ12-2 GN=MAXJ12_12747 PE=4 SV=1: ParBc [Gemmataceae bacterium]VTT96352.1 MT-A70 family protein OS=Mesorhizobium alhagi CCNWXJ12-2 GN=MAXJ12_12747 PE=4 SV=1: ParBc [Gemmataceae bacterium]
MAQRPGSFIPKLPSPEVVTVSEQQIVKKKVAELKKDTFQFMPPYGEEEMARLIANVGLHGVKEPIHVDEQDAILDGHNRTTAAEQAGLAEVPCIVVTGLTDIQKRQYAYRQLYKRKLDRQQLRAITTQAIKQFSTYSNAWIASTVNESENTVAKERRRLIEANEIEDHAELMGLDGKKQPAKKPKKAVANPVAPKPNAPQPNAPQPNALPPDGQQANAAVPGAAKPDDAKLDAGVPVGAVPDAQVPANGKYIEGVCKRAKNGITVVAEGLDALTIPEQVRILRTYDAKEVKTFHAAHIAVLLLPADVYQMPAKK